VSLCNVQSRNVLLALKQNNHSKWRVDGAFITG